MSKAGDRGRESGMTLLELLLVIAIAALVFAVLPASIFSGGSSVELRSTAREIAQDLRRARGRAIARNADVGFFLDVTERRFGILGSKETATIPQSVRVEFLAAAEELAAPDRGVIRFFPDGSSTGGGVRLIGEKQQYEVNVRWLTGLVSLAE